MQKKTLTFFYENTLWFLLFGLAFVQPILNQKLIHLDTAWIEPPPESLQKKNPQLFSALTFGYLPVIIDWLFLQCLLDTSLSPVPHNTHPSFYYDLDLATDLDPAFLEAYLAGAHLLAVVRKDATGARDLLVKARTFIQDSLPSYPVNFKNQFWPKPWRILLPLAYTYLFELEDLPSAAQAFTQASRYPNAPSYLSPLANRLQQKGGEYQVGLQLLNFMLTSPHPAPIQAQLETKRLHLFIAQFIYELNESFQEFLNSQAYYRKFHTFTAAKLNSYWKDFLRIHHISTQDPWGGKLFLNEQGKAMTTTPYESVFQLH